MRILQLGKFYPIRGGVERVMESLIQGLGARGVDCDMLCACLPGQKPGVIECGPHYRIICVPAVKKIAATMISPAMISYLRKHHDYDIIHVHHPDPMAALALRLSGYRGKVVLHWHSDILKQKKLLRLYAPLQKWLLKRAAVIIGTTPVYVKESPFLKDYQNKTAALPIGIQPVVSNGEKVRKIREGVGTGKLVFSLGRFVEYKGFEYLIEAASMLPDGYKMVIGGEGPLWNRMVEKAESMGLRDRISFPGRISDEDLPSWFEACDIFVLSSTLKTEAFAIVQVEAMCCGKPVVATKIPGSGVSWVNADGVSGINVPVCDSKALADAIRKVCEDDGQYEKYAAGARDRYERFFTRSKMIDDCIGIYNSVLG